MYKCISCKVENTVVMLCKKYSGVVGIVQLLKSCNLALLWSIITRNISFLFSRESLNVSRYNCNEFDFAIQVWHSLIKRRYVVWIFIDYVICMWQKKYSILLIENKFVKFIKHADPYYTKYTQLPNGLVITLFSTPQLNSAYVPSILCLIRTLTKLPCSLDHG